MLSVSVGVSHCRARSVVNLKSVRTWRGWIDAIIQPQDTRAVLLQAFALACRAAPKPGFHTGVLQV